MAVDIEQVIDELRSSSANMEKYLEIRKLANVGSMVGGIAHKFNNVLGGILGYAQLLKEDLPIDSESYKKAAIIESAAKKASKLILQLHLFTHQKHAYRKRPVDPKGLVLEITAIAESAFNPNVRIRTKIEHGSRCVMADFQSLSLVIFNLVLNARDAMPLGGDLQISTSLENKDGQSHVIFEVSDTGDGIATEDLPKVFDPFFSSKKDTTASGLGLTVAKELIEDHSGAIQIESTRRQGTTVRVSIPALSATAPIPMKNDEFNEVTGEGALIMMVDDERDLREMARSIFERKGFKVLLADSGESAIRLFNENAQRIKLVILDMILPGPNGNQVYREIKRNASQPKIILTSGLSKDSPAIEFEEDENDFFVPKPWDLPELIDTVCRLLQSDAEV